MHCAMTSRTISNWLAGRLFLFRVDLRVGPMNAHSKRSGNDSGVTGDGLAPGYMGEIQTQPLQVTRVNAWS